MHPLTIVLIVSLVFAVQGSPTTLIIGGRNATHGKYPYQISLRQFNQHLCGGSIINKHYVLTAAHCIAKRSPKDMLVVAGTIYLNDRLFSYTVEKTISHEWYDSTNIVHDIGLVRVTNAIEFSSTVQPIALALTRVAAGTSAVVTGWGRFTTRNNNLPNVLQEIELTVISKEKCSALMGEKPDTQICTFTKYNEGVCNGDSGGPLVVKGVQIGIVSHGIPCGVGYPDVFTSVERYQDWINYNIDSYVKWSNNACSRTMSFFVISTAMIALCWIS